MIVMQGGYSDFFDSIRQSVGWPTDGLLESYTFVFDYHAIHPCMALKRKTCKIVILQFCVSKVKAAC